MGNPDEVKLLHHWEPGWSEATQYCQLCKVGDRGVKRAWASAKLRTAGWWYLCEDCTKVRYECEEYRVLDEE